jgi:aspartate 1-decarboxylase
MPRTSRRGRDRAVREGRNQFVHDYRRIATYVFPGAAEGEFTLNGGAALHFQLGERVVAVTYRQEESFSGANYVIVDPSDNSITEVLRYKTAG